MEYLSIPSWDTYQHYKDGRRIHWIKLWINLLDKYKADGTPNEWRSLSDRAVRLLISIWMLRARYDQIPYDTTWIHEQTGVQAGKAIQELITLGFITVYQNRTNSVPIPYQDRTLDREKEIEREREEEEDTHVASAPLSPSGDVPVNGKIDTLVQDWNRLAEQSGLPTVQRIGTRRRNALRRLQDSWWREHYRDALGKIPQSDFLLGRVPGKNWRANFEWFLRPETVTKLLEDNYGGDSAIVDFAIKSPTDPFGD